MDSPHFEWWSYLPVDKVVHAVVFAGLMVLGASGRRGAAPRSLSAELRTLILGLSIYAVAIEVCQHLLPWRSFEILDLVADGLGIVLGWLVVAWTLRSRRYRQPAEP